jgi:hypothetical protein
VILEYANAFPGQPRRVIPPISKVYGGPVPYLLVKLDQPFQTPPPASLPPDSTNYSFYRKAQPIAGEPVLQMPRDIAIDISRDDKNPPSWYRMYPWSANVLGTQPFKILFDPKGQVIGQEGRAGNRICLWVRDVSNNVFPNSFNDRNATDPNVLPPGDNSLITIYTRTGLITAHPIDDSKDAAGNYLRLRPGPTWNPFYFTQDGRSSGM